MPRYSALLFTFLMVAGGCSKSKNSSSRGLSDFCNGVEFARIGYAGYLGAAKNEAKLAVDSSDRRAGMCAVMASSLRSTSAYLLGFGNHYALANTATDGAAIHISSPSLLANLVEAEAHCQNGELKAVNGILSKIEQEIESAFDEQLQACKKRGWEPKGVRGATDKKR